MKNVYCFAGEVFEIDSFYSYFNDFAKEYLTDKTANYFIKISNEEIKDWAASHDDCKGFTLEYIETLVIHAKIAALLALKNKFIFHGSTIYVDSLENAYIFTAPSGTGKSTHVSLLRKVFNNRVNYVNDDKPFLSYENNKFFVYGSPWNGKERLSNDVKAELKGVFIIERSKTNEVAELSRKEAVYKLVPQMHFAKGIKETENASLTLVNLAKNIPCYLLKVNMEDDAARTSMKIMEK